MSLDLYLAAEKAAWKAVKADPSAANFATWHRTLAQLNAELAHRQQIVADLQMSAPPLTK